jgi:prolyl-tRNA synthetase
VNYGRDFQNPIVTDISAAEAGFACPECGTGLTESRGVEVGNIFKLGTKYTQALGANYLDKNGKTKPIVMGSYGIGSGRLLACIVEEHNDENGLVLPITVSPYQVHLVALRGGEKESEKLYNDLVASGLEVLFDDRDDSPGVKFNDADLIGVPIRITVSERSLKKEGVEIKLRKGEEKTSVKLSEVIENINKFITELEAEIAEKVIEVPFEE